MIYLGGLLSFCLVFGIIFKIGASKKPKTKFKYQEGDKVKLKKTKKVFEIQEGFEVELDGVKFILYIAEANSIRKLIQENEIIKRI